jgi:hypothetical protein
MKRKMTRGAVGLVEDLLLVRELLTVWVNVLMLECEVIQNADDVLRQRGHGL